MMKTPPNQIAEELIDWLYEQKLSPREAVAVMGIAMPALLSTMVNPQDELKAVYGIMSLSLACHEKGIDI